MIDTLQDGMKAFSLGLRRLRMWFKKKKKRKEKLLYEIIPRFGLLRSLESDNGTLFTSQVTQGASKALDITYYVHSAWRPQSSGKIERANQFLKSAIKIINQETSLEWKEALPIALLRTRIARKRQVGLSPMRCYMGDLLFMSMTSS